MAGKNVTKLHVTAIDGAGRVVILLYDGAFERQTCEYAFGSGVGKQFRIHFPISSGGCVAAHRTRGHGPFTAKRKLAREQLLETLVIHDEHNQVNTFEADLQSYIAATNRDECWRAPAVGRA